MWFHLPSFIQMVDAPTFARGLQVYRGQQVQALEVAWMADAHWRLSGPVKGTQRQPYHVTVELHLMPDGTTLDRWQGRCNCPVGSQCKHAVALMLKAVYQGKALADAAAQRANAEELARLAPEERQRREAATQLRDQERQRQQVQAELQRLRNLQAQAAERWLRADVGTASALPGGAGLAREKGVRTESPMYLIQHQDNDGSHARLRLYLGTSSLKLKGGWTKPREVGPKYFLQPSQGYRERDVALTDADRETLELLGALPASSRAYYNYNADTDWPLDGIAGPMVLARAAATQRLFWRQDDGTPGKAIAWGPELALQWQWVTQPGPTPDDALWQLQPQLPPPEARLCANQPQALYIDLGTGQCGQVHSGQALNSAGGMLQNLLQAPPLPQQVMLKHQATLLQRLGDVAPMPAVLPALQRVGGQPVWRLHLSRVLDDDADAPASAEVGLLTAQVDFDYQGHHGWWPQGTEHNVVLAHEGQRVLLTRDLASEQAAVASLIRLGLTEWTEGMFALPPGMPQTPWLLWADAQFQPLRDAGFEVSMDAELHHWVRHAGDVVVDVTPQHRAGPHGSADSETDAHGEADTGSDTGSDEATAISDWFDLSLGLEVDGQRINVLPLLPQLIQSLRSGADRPAPSADDPPPSDHLPPYVYLPAPDGKGFVRLATAPIKPWLEALLELFDDHRTDFDADSLRLSRFDALRASVSLGEGVAWDGAQQLMQLARQLQGHAELPVTPKPAGLVADMRPYQQHGLDWLQFLRTHGLAGILADDMGLGKTLQTLAHIQVEKEAGRLNRPALVVAPVSLMGNWQREAARFCPSLKTLVLHGADRHSRASDMAHADLVMAPYSLLHRDRERWLNQPWHLVVLDEAQNIKNAHTQAAQVVAELNTRHRLCLSGTPIENHLGEIWSLFHFLMPGFLGSQAKFQQRFRNPIEKHGDGQRLAQLRARLTPFILRRTKQLVAHELPPKVESVMTVELSGKQADLYETIRLSMEESVRQAIADKGLAKSQILFLDALLKLRQVCCDPRLVKTPAAAKVKTSAKLEQLMEMLPEMLAEGRRVLLFSQFTSMLSLIEDELRKAKIEWVKLTGQTQKRDEVIDRFTSGQVPVFLISLKAGGVGLNLPQADTVIHFDPWWNPAVENQATDRAHRIGQTQSVWVIKLVAQGTIEERILALQARKAELANEIYSGSVGRMQPLFTEADVRELLRPLS